MKVVLVGKLTTAAGGSLSALGQHMISPVKSLSVVGVFIE